MEALEKTEKLNQLFELYQDLLTEKQREYYQLYYYEDYSLQEIATTLSISRNAVYDQLNKVEQHLLNYEQILKLNEKKILRLTYLNQYEHTKDEKYLKMLRKMDES
ncbi:MAG: hypothetical protein GX312_01155 [Candidatus Phytoplasma sp.]|nr:hypothetical protein [Phytoplasma sp.]